MTWVNFHNSIPENLKYDGWQTDKNDENHNVLYIYLNNNNDNENIPEELFYENWEKDGPNLLRSLIFGNYTHIPECLY